METTRILLDQSEIPTHWYNVVADLANPPAPLLGPDGQPVPPQKMAEIFPMNILEQEMSAQRWIRDPRGSTADLRAVAAGPLCRALRLEQALVRRRRSSTRTKASRAGHKPNSAVPHY